jgi:hypothetical protein
MLEANTGATYLIEMNARCTPVSHLRLGKDRDLAGALWAKLSGEPMQDRAAITQKNLIAYFPQAWMRKSEFLDSSFQDIPQDEPDLIKELLRPWPDRSLLYRLGHALTNGSVREKYLKQ